MSIFFQSLSKKIWNASFFLFLALFIVSFGFYALADEEGNGKNFFQDTDQDGLSNEEEKAYGTDPDNNDTDNDGYSDGVEIEGGYDPLKPAPGDRIVVEEESSGKVEGMTTDESNYTLKTSTALAEIVQGVAANADAENGVKLEDVDTAIENALGTGAEEIALPEIDLDDIKIKKIPKNLKGEKRDERIRKDVVEYLTLVGYLMMNSSPVSIQSENDLKKVAEKISTDSVNSLTAGDLSYLDTLEEQGNKFLDQIKDVEVPESMLETHVKALKLAKYASGLKSEVKASGDDPLGQVSAYGSVQAFLIEVQAFADDVQTKLGEYGIDDLPFGL